MSRGASLLGLTILATALMGLLVVLGLKYTEKLNYQIALQECTRRVAAARSTTDSLVAFESDACMSLFNKSK